MVGLTTWRTHARPGRCAARPALRLLVIERLFEDTDLGEGAPVVAMAFGPGLTLYPALLRRRR